MAGSKKTATMPVPLNSEEIHHAESRVPLNSEEIHHAESGAIEAERVVTLCEPDPLIVQLTENSRCAADVNAERKSEISIWEDLKQMPSTAGKSSHAKCVNCF